MHCIIIDSIIYYLFKYIKGTSKYSILKIQGMHLKHPNLALLTQMSFVNGKAYFEKFLANIVNLFLHVGEACYNL